ncbi:effector-associated constant component EACC1 [Streptomyces atroolivaceus]|uniref:effector-associated constant component EACC1 n=1 Tax=Streptomyces atroolivaceus TaxID=66869 RepID=UPI0036B4ADF0
MRITLEVGGPAEAEHLRRWLRRDPALRNAVGRAPPGTPAPDSMSGGAAELVPVLLAPGGLTAAVAAAIVAWLQSRRGSQTVTITRPDGTQVTVTSEGVAGLTPQRTADVAQQVAEMLQQQHPATADEPEGRQPDPVPPAQEADGRRRPSSVPGTDDLDDQQPPVVNRA